MGALARPHEESKKIKEKRKAKKTYVDGCPRLQEGFVAALEGFGFSPELGLDVKGHLGQGARPSPGYLAGRCGAGRFDVEDRRARSTGF